MHRFDLIVDKKKKGKEKLDFNHNFEKKNYFINDFQLRPKIYLTRTLAACKLKATEGYKNICVYIYNIYIAGLELKVQIMLQHRLLLISLYL